MMTHWPSPAKLNLFLYITGQRADGYHSLQTLFQFLDYGDTIDIPPRSDGEIHLLTPVEGVAHEDNLIVRAARLLMKVASESNRLPKGSGADISIDKRLPMGGGLGGGGLLCRYRVRGIGAGGGLVGGVCRSGHEEGGGREGHCGESPGSCAARVPVLRGVHEGVL